MLRILIVDDERIILNGIRMMIENELELPFPTDIVTASNVPQAIEMLEHFTPDLVLADIRMPVMDGFDPIRHIREKSSSLNIVILTSHADFDYAQQAIRFRVTDFILKPIDQQLLKNTIERAYQQKKETEKTLLHSTFLEIRNMMLYDLPEQELTSSYELIRQLFPYTYFTVIVLTLSQTDESWCNILEKILSRYYNLCYCFSLSEHNQLIAICNHEQFFIKPLDLEQEFLKSSHCDTFWTGISISSNSYKSLHALYANAVQRIFYIRHFGESKDLAELSLFTYQDCVRIFLENDDDSMRCLLEKYLTNITATSSQVNTPELIYRSFFHNILLYLENNNITVQENPSHNACQFSNYQEIIPEIMTQLHILKNNIRKNGDRYGNDALTKQLLGYIQQHYQEDVSLDDLASHVGLHPNYVCTVFKKNIGQSYLACLHKERLKATKKLLLETDYTVEQIANMVGYNSASQLARVFRKYESVSPSEFRNSPEKKQEPL